MEFATPTGKTEHAPGPTVRKSRTTSPGRFGGLLQSLGTNQAEKTAASRSNLPSSALENLQLAAQLKSGVTAVTTESAQGTQGVAKSVLSDTPDPDWMPGMNGVMEDGTRITGEGLKYLKSKSLRHMMKTQRDKDFWLEFLKNPFKTQAKVTWSLSEGSGEPPIPGQIKDQMDAGNLESYNVKYANRGGKYGYLVPNKPKPTTGTDKPIDTNPSDPKPTDGAASAASAASATSAALVSSLLSKSGAQPSKVAASGEPNLQIAHPRNHFPAGTDRPKLAKLHPGDTPIHGELGPEPSAGAATEKSEFSAMMGEMQGKVRAVRYKVLPSSARESVDAANVQERLPDSAHLSHKMAAMDSREAHTKRPSDSKSDKTAETSIPRIGFEAEKTLPMEPGSNSGSGNRGKSSDRREEPTLLNKAGGSNGAGTQGVNGEWPIAGGGFKLEANALAATTRPMDPPLGDGNLNQLDELLGKAFLIAPKAVTLELNPQSMGSVRIQVQIERDQISAQIQTEHLYTAQLIKENQGELDRRLRDRGFEFSHIEVRQEKGGQQDSQQHSGFSQQQQQQQQQQQRQEAAFRQLMGQGRAQEREADQLRIPTPRHKNQGVDPMAVFA